MNERLHQHVAWLANRLGDFLGRLGSTHGEMASSVAFLQSVKAEPIQSYQPAADGLGHMVGRLGISGTEIDLLILAGMPDVHEGYSAIFRSLHPRGESRPTVGLAAQLFGLDANQRWQLRELLEVSPLATLGILRASGDGPFFERTLQLAELLWPVLDGLDCWPRGLAVYTRPVPLAGMEEWLDTPAAARALLAMRSRDRCTIFISADSEDLAFERGLVLARAADRISAGILVPPATDEMRQLMEAHSLVRGATPVLRLLSPEGPAHTPTAWFEAYPDTAVLCCREGSAVIHSARPVLSLPAERLTNTSRRRMWQAVLPEMDADQTARLSVYSVEPATASELAADLECIGRLEQRRPTAQDLISALRARTSLTQSAGMRMIRPRAGWDSLVLPRDREEQLREAVSRLTHQEKVFDEWGFLRGRPGTRGVRMLFSGPPGTGKTLAAEVLAREIGVDLLVVDISRVVSKWVGETEKNLATVFDTAERAQAVCFFDEADALFGRRTEVSDAHDRYANLETAYLLSRLERFEGLAVLATNLRQNIDSAFMRRLEYLVDFDEPDREERFRLWTGHIPNQRLLAPDVNLYEFAALYPVTGGFIRNAALSAAFLAAANGGEITRHHLFHAVRREYHKSGRLFPAMPVGTRL